MNTLSSTEYYVSREQRERELAAAASNPAVVAAHRDMAERYAYLIQSSASIDDRPLIQFTQGIE